MTKQRIQLGRKGEDAAVDFLKNHGYRILQRNVKTAFGEIDIIAKDRHTLCFVEVRTRTKPWHGHPLESITYAKRRKLIQNALVYLKDKNLLETEVRFDVVAVIPNDQGIFDVEIVKDAFEA